MEQTMRGHSCRQNDEGDVDFLLVCPVVRASPQPKWLW